MAPKMKLFKRHNGVTIYSSAKTHPNAKTVSLCIFTTDCKRYAGRELIKRFRYRRFSDDITQATAAACKFINDNL